MSEIYVHRYELRSRERLNAQSERRVFEGALLRIGEGYGCLHPWPELGDEPLEEQLECLREARPTRLIARAYRCAGVDGLARREGRSLFSGLQIPESHALVAGGSVEQAVKSGFRVIKLKCMERVSVETERVHEIAARLRKTEVRLRLDFNEALSEGEFREFCASVGEATLERVEFAEDPFPYEAEAWKRVEEECGVRLAVDRGAGEAEGGFSYRVIKPAVDEVEVLLERAKRRGERVVVTSYLDHPVGQMYAAYEAARADEEQGVEVCGLLSHGMFEGDSFIAQVRSEGPKLMAPGGTGLGFDELLESLPWEKLK